MARKYVDADSMGKGLDPLTGRACESVDGCARGWWPPARAGSMQAAGEAEESSVRVSKPEASGTASPRHSLSVGLMGACWDIRGRRNGERAGGQGTQAC